MREIDEALDGRLDYLFVATSTTGTLRGCCDYLRSRAVGTPASSRSTRPAARCSAASARSGGSPASARASRPASRSAPASTGWCGSTTSTACRLPAARRSRSPLRRRVLRRVAFAFDSLADAMEPGSRCALILADGGAGYLDTVYERRVGRAELGLEAERVTELVAAGTGRALSSA